MRNLSLLIIGVVLTLIFTISTVNAQRGYSPGQGMGQGMGQEEMGPQRMLQKLGPADTNYDLRFMNMMIMHKQHGNIMAKDALQKSKRPEVRNLAQKIINENNADIQQLQSLRQQLYGQ